MGEQQTEAQAVPDVGGLAGAEFAARLGALADRPDLADLARFAVGDPVDGWRPYRELRDLADENPPRERVFGQLMGYTSGTTGMPKGVYRPSVGVTPESLVHAGAPCPVHVKRAMIEWVGPILWEYLGATEGIVAIAPPTDFDTRPGSVGRVGPDAVQIVNGDEEAAAGEAGTIYFRTSLPYEYLNAAEKTAESRRGDFVTVGDVGYVDEDGYLFTLDRRTDLILSGGVNVYPAEIESHLLQHPSVEDDCVIGVPDDEWGQRVVAVVQPKPGLSGDALIAELTEHARHGLASYKRPRQIELRDELPRSAAGKLQRRLVRALYVPS